MQQKGMDREKKEIIFSHFRAITTHNEIDREKETERDSKKKVSKKLTSHKDCHQYVGSDKHKNNLYETLTINTWIYMVVFHHALIWTAMLLPSKNNIHLEVHWKCMMGKSLFWALDARHWVWSDAYTDIEDVSIHTLYTVLFACERVRVGYTSSFRTKINRQNSRSLSLSHTQPFALH